MEARAPRPSLRLRLGRAGLAAALLTTAAGCGALHRTAGEGAHFVDLYAVARKTCDAELRDALDGREAAVRYPAYLGESAARRLLDSTREYEREVEEDYRLLRKGLARHLGDELFSRIAGRAYLRPAPPRTLWFLLPGDPTALIWRGPPGSAYHFLGAGAAPHSKLAGQVHEIVHWIVRDLVSSRRGRLPRWYEEGLCEWGVLHFRRWKEGRWDGGREVLARLTWDRAQIRRRLLRWAHAGLRGSLQAWHERNWESDLLYSGALGLQFALESELGPGGPVEILKELIAASPETDAATRELMERRVGKPVEEWGEWTPAARRELLEDLLRRGQGGCAQRRAVPGSVPLAALGHFPDESARVIPALRSLAACADPAVAAEGITGLRYLGAASVLRQVLDERRARAGVSGDSGPVDDARWKMAEEFAASPRRAWRWFGRAS